MPLSPASNGTFLIDGLNLAYWCGSPPSLRLPLSAMAGLLAAGHPARMVFDASAPYRLGAEAALYAELAQHEDWVLQVPSGRRADGVILKQANQSGACVLSRDRFRDYRRRYRRLIDDPARLLSGEVRENHLLIPALGLRTPLFASSAEALAHWRQSIAL